jgi:hypothetical protein
MQKLFFDMKDGVPMRDRVGIDLKGNREAIEHCNELAQHFREDSCATIKTLRYLLSTRSDVRFVVSSFIVSKTA